MGTNQSDTTFAITIETRDLVLAARLGRILAEHGGAIANPRAESDARTDDARHLGELARLTKQRDDHRLEIEDLRSIIERHKAAMARSITEIDMRENATRATMNALCSAAQKWETTERSGDVGDSHNGPLLEAIATYEAAMVAICDAEDMPF